MKTRFERDLEKAKQRVEAVEKQGLGVAVVPSFSQTSDDALNKTAAPTGLLTVEEFKRKREQMVAEKQRARMRDEKTERQLEKRAKASRKARLSFLDQVEDQEEAPVEAPSPRSVALGKDPTVDSSFLPDRAREAEEEKIREELARQWEEEQEKVKKEPMVVTFSFWDGKGHRRAHRCLKGTTIGEFLAQIKEQIEELEGTSSSNLLFVKEDVIIPHHFTFHELITTKARGRNGCAMFIFDEIVDDENKDEDTHVAKVCERRWYDKNRHIFPASRWTIYDGGVGNNAAK